MVRRNPQKILSLSDIETDKVKRSKKILPLTDTISHMFFENLIDQKGK